MHTIMETQARTTSPREEYDLHHRSPQHAGAQGRGIGSEAQATRPQFPSGGSSPAAAASFVKHLQQNRSRAVPVPGLQQQQHEVVEYPESMTRSVSTLSSPHPNSSVDGSPTSCSRSPEFDTAVYDPTSDSIHIMPHSRQNSLDAQFQDFKNRINNVKTHQVKMLSLARPQSLNLPLRTRESSRELRSAHNQEVDIPTRACSVKSRRSVAKSFDLMAPPPGKRRSCMTYVDGPLDTLVEPSETVDADPSDALTSQIASSILRERYGVDSAEAVPLKVQEAVRTCLRDVSSTVEHEHPQWGLPTYRSSKGFRSSMNGSEATPRAHARNSNSDARRSRKRGPSQRGDDDDDPFPYDERNNKDGSGNQRGGLRDPTLKKKAKLQSNLQGYPCPYRRRNPVFFNIREHEHCARRNFTDITELKRHVRTYHRKQRAPYQCPRCRSGFASEETLSNHLTVPLEKMCEPQKFAPGTSPDEGITEEMDRILADRTAKNKVQTWEEIWRLLFGPDTMVLEPDFLPIVEVVEAEQEFEDSADDLKHDLCDRLCQLLPEHAGDIVFFQVLAGQIQLVVEQHRAKVNRRCRQNAGIPSAKKKNETGSSATNTNGTGPDTTRHRSTSSRFSLSAAAHASQSSIHRFSPPLPRRSNTNTNTNNTTTVVHPPRTIGSPANAITASSSSSSVYSKRSSLYSSNSSASNSSRAHTRSSGSSVSHSNNGNPTLHNSMLQVESPRLPFRDWVHGIKLSNETGEAKGSPPPSSLPGQRDSGLALQCDLCYMDPCQCGGGGSYADQLSAFMTPAVMTGGAAGQGMGGVGGGQQQQHTMMLGGGANGPYGGGMVTPAANKTGMMMYEADNIGEIDWAAHYGAGLTPAGGLLTAPSSHGALGQLSEDHEER